MNKGNDFGVLQLNNDDEADNYHFSKVWSLECRHPKLPLDFKQWRDLCLDY